MADEDVVPFSPLAEFLASTEAQGGLQKFLETWEGGLFIAASRELALSQTTPEGATFQDGARNQLEMMLNLALSRQNIRKKRAKQSGSGRPPPRTSLHNAPLPKPSPRINPQRPPDAPPPQGH
jgi:hypothetical protein